MATLFSLYASIGLLILLVFSFYVKNHIFAVLSATGIFVMGIYVTINGFEGIQDIMTPTIGFIFIGLGAYIGIGSWIDIMETE